MEFVLIDKPQLSSRKRIEQSEGEQFAFLFSRFWAVAGRKGTVDGDPSSQRHRAEGEVVQQEFGAFDTKLWEAVGEIWKKPGIEQEQPVDPWAVMIQERERDLLIDPVERMQRLEMGAVDWKLDLLRTR